MNFFSKIYSYNRVNITKTHLLNVLKRHLLLFRIIVLTIIMLYVATMTRARTLLSLDWIFLSFPPPIIAFDRLWSFFTHLSLLPSSICNLVIVIVVLEYSMMTSSFLSLFLVQQWQRRWTGVNQNMRDLWPQGNFVKADKCGFEAEHRAGGLLSKESGTRDGRHNSVHSRHSSFCIHLSVDDDAYACLPLNRQNRQRTTDGTRLTSVQVSDVSAPAAGHSKSFGEGEERKFSSGRSKMKEKDEKVESKSKAHN